MTFYVMLIALCLIIDFSTFFMSSVKCSQLQSSYCANILYSHVFANILDKTRNHQLTVTTSTIIIITIIITTITTITTTITMLAMAIALEYCLEYIFKRAVLRFFCIFCLCTILIHHVE